MSRYFILSGFLVALFGLVAPVEADSTLTLRFIVGTGHESRTLLIAGANNNSPPRLLGPIVDASGMHMLDVKVLGAYAAACQHAPVRRIGLGKHRFCLDLSGIAAGQEYKGQLELTGSANPITLTVNARHGWFFPILVSLAALMLAVLAAFLSTHYLPDQLAKVLLKHAKLRGGSIQGLNGWADAATSRLAPADILARLEWANRYGRRAVLAARAELGSKAGSAAWLANSPLSRSCTEEAERTEVTVDDLLTQGGGRKVSKAEHLLDLVERADRIVTEFRAVSEQMRDQFSPGDPRREVIEDIITQSGNDDQLLSDITFERWATIRNDQLESIVNQAQVNGQGQQVFGLAAVNLSPSIRRHISVAAPASTRFVAAMGAALLAAIILMSTAVITTLFAQYAPNAAFGTVSDYLGLAASAFGSSTAVGILSVLLLMRGPQNWYG